MGSRVTPQPRTSAAAPGVVGRTTMHQLPKSTPTEASGALYAESLLSQCVAAVLGLAGHDTERCGIDEEVAAHDLDARAAYLRGELPQRLIVQRRIARPFQDEIARHPAADDGGVGKQMRIEHLVRRPGLQCERGGGELGQRGRSEALRRIELLDDAVVVIEVYGRG